MSGRIDVTEVKEVAHERWPEILRTLAPELSEAIDAGPNRKVCCPLPEHDDQDPSFRIDKPHEGRAICSCGSHDAWELLQKLRSWTFGQAVDRVADHLGINGHALNGQAKPDLLAQVCQAKRMPIESARAYGAHIAKRGKLDVVRFPVVNEQGEIHSHFDLSGDGGKGWFATGRGMSGLFFPIDDGKPRLPAPGETWIQTEGGKDATAYYGLGFLACGLPTDQMNAKFARLFRDVNVIIMPDRTADAEAKAQKTAARLHGVAASVRIGSLPLEIVGDRGDDARDVLKLPDGDKLLRQAVDDAVEWKPPESTGDKEDLTDIAFPSGQTDSAHATRFVDAYHRELLYVPPWKKWLSWDGTRWADDNGVGVLQRAKRYGQSLWAELGKFAPEMGRDDLAKIVTAIKQANQTSKIRSYLDLAAVDERVVCPVDELNSDPSLLNVANGTIDLETGKLRPHNPADRITQLANVAYDPDATCPQWERTLSLVFDGDGDLIRYVQKLLGYSISGDTGEHILPIAYGKGCNGKSTVWNLVTDLLGEYATLANDELLLGDKSNHPTEKAALYQMRFAAISEPERNSSLREARVKELTGDRTVTARPMHEDFWSFQRTHTFWLSTNHLPRIDGTMMVSGVA